MHTLSDVDVAAIHALIERRSQAIRTRNVNAALACLAPQSQLFDVVNPLKYSGVEATRTRLSQWIASFEGPIGFEIAELDVAAGQDVAFSHGLNHVSATKTDGQKLDMWWRATVCYRKLDGKWMITHEHSSVPFDMTTGKASLDLKP